MKIAYSEFLINCFDFLYIIHCYCQCIHLNNFELRNTCNWNEMFKKCAIAVNKELDNIS